MQRRWRHQVGTLLATCCCLPFRGLASGISPRSGVYSRENQDRFRQIVVAAGSSAIQKRSTMAWNCSRRWRSIFTSTITSARTRHSAIGRRPICSRTERKGRGRCHDGGLCPQTPWDLSLLFSRMDVFALLQTAPAVQSRGLIGRQGNVGIRPERRLKPGMDGGLTAAVLVSPPLHLRTDEILSNQWGPPHSLITTPFRKTTHLTRIVAISSLCRSRSRYGVVGKAYAQREDLYRYVAATDERRLG